MASGKFPILWRHRNFLSYGVNVKDFLFHGVMEISYFMASKKFFILWRECTHQKDFLFYGVMEISYPTTL